MNSLAGDDVSFLGVSMCYHPMMNTLNILNHFPCSGFVKKSASIDYVGQYSMLNSSLLTLSLTGEYLIGMCREFTVHELRPFPPIFVTLSLS